MLFEARHVSNDQHGTERQVGSRLRSSIRHSHRNDPFHPGQRPNTVQSPGISTGNTLIYQPYIGDFQHQPTYIGGDQINFIEQHQILVLTAIRPDSEYKYRYNNINFRIANDKVNIGNDNISNLIILRCETGNHRFTTNKRLKECAGGSSQPDIRSLYSPIDHSNIYAIDFKQLHNGTIARRFALNDNTSGFNYMRAFGVFIYEYNSASEEHLNQLRTSNRHSVRCRILFCWFGFEKRFCLPQLICIRMSSNARALALDSRGESARFGRCAAACVFASPFVWLSTWQDSGRAGAATVARVMLESITRAYVLRALQPQTYRCKLTSSCYLIDTLFCTHCTVCTRYSTLQ